MKRITVVLADDHTVVREGLRMLLAVEPDIEIVGEAANGAEAIGLAKKTRPTVVVMDLAMPILNGLDATREIRKCLPDTRVLVLTSYNDPDYIRQTEKAGVSGYILKHAATVDLVNAIRHAAEGKKVYSRTVAERLERTFRMRGTRNDTGALSDRELQVLQLVSEGFPNRRIGAVLGLSTKTVEKHRQHVMDKLDIHDVAGLTRYAHAKGLLFKPGDGFFEGRLAEAALLNAAAAKEMYAAKGQHRARLE